MHHPNGPCRDFRNRRFAWILPLLLPTMAALNFETASAARVDLSYARVRADGGAVVAATLEDVQEVYEKRPGLGDQPVVTAYRFKLHVVEVLYGGDIEAGDVVQIDKSYVGYGSVWESNEETAGYGGLGGQSSMPPNGTKVIAFLQPPQDGERDLYPYLGSVLVVSAFDDPRVETWRRIGRLWSMRPSRELFAELVQGSQSGILPYQMYCLEVLSEYRAGRTPFPDYTGIRLEGIATQGEIDAQLWKVFTDETTPLESVRACDRSFSSLVPNAQGTWQMHPIRYDVLRAAIRRHVASGQLVDWQQMTHAVALLTENPSRADETRKLILSLAATPPVASPDRYLSHPSQVLTQLYRLYVTNAASVESGDQNKQIIEDLTARLDDPEIRATAATALWQIAEVCATVGNSQDDIIELIKQKEERIIANGEEAYFHTNWRVPQIRESIARARAAIGATKLPDPLTWPYDDQLEKQVCLVQYGINSPPNVEVEGERPRTAFHPKYAIVVGTLKKHSVPYFNLVPDKGFENGIPVPSGYSAESIAVRYSLENPSWIVVPSSK